MRYLALAALFLLACGDETKPTEIYSDPGAWILDSGLVLDEYRFNTAACTEVFPPGSQSADTLPPGSVAAVVIRSISCYSLRVRVVNADSDTVRVFDTRFGIFNRTEEEKNRGVQGFAAWDGKDGSGKDLGPGRYLWRMEFDFGQGRKRHFRADILIP